MPTIVVASPKGGSGKSTTSVILGTEFAINGVNVTMLDCDPNESLSLWASKSELPDNIKVLSNVKEEEIIKTIKKYDSDNNIVIVDCEGIASRLISRAISQADIVVTPMRATTLDASIGAKAIALVQEEEEALEREIKQVVVFTMTRAIMSKQHRGLEKSFIEQGIDVIQPSLMERAAYSALFEYGGNLRTLPPQGNMDAAIENAQAFTHSIFTKLVA